MCAIAGVIGKNGQIIDAESIKKMTDKMAHRGPDAEGFFVEGNLGMGHRRLSIIDISAHGNQPLESSDCRFQIVFNGEIYNYIEIKKELSDLGAIFHTETDTEVIIEAYREWGESCTTHFNGMWSFCIFDREERVLFISRDRFGVKPLYILDRSDYFVFASEIKAITELFPDEKVTDDVQIARYLRGIQEDCDEHTFYKNIKNFPVASSITYNLLDNTYDIEQYWTIGSSAINLEKNSSKAIQQCRNLLTDAINLRLRSDVPLGASLSGGLDSSAIVEIVSKVFNKVLYTFSSIYEGEEGYDEKEFIDCVNEDADTTPHHVYPGDGKDILEDLEQLLYYHDCPPFCASPYSGFNVYREAKKHVKVLMDGQGADEIFVGYYYLINEYLKNELSRNSFKGRIKAVKIIGDVFSIWKRQRILDDALVINALGVSLYKKYDRRLKKFEPRHWRSDKRLFSKKLMDINIDIDFDDEKDIKEGILRKQYHEQFHGILPRILHDVDRNSMANSLEVRLPFLDYRLVEFSYSIPDYLKYKNGWTKYVLRKAVKKYMPKKIWSRRNKMGFPAPFEKWMRDVKYESRIREYITKLSKRGLFDEASLMKEYEDQLNGDLDDPDMFFRFMMLEMWLQKEIDTETEKWHL